MCCLFKNIDHRGQFVSYILYFFPLATYHFQITFYYDGVIVLHCLLHGFGSLLHYTSLLVMRCTPFAQFWFLASIMIVYLFGLHFTSFCILACLLHVVNVYLGNFLHLVIPMPRLILASSLYPRYS